MFLVCIFVLSRCLIVVRAKLFLRGTEAQNRGALHPHILCLVQRYVQPGVTFANAISGTVIWQVDQRVTIGWATREISKRTGADINKIQFLNDRGRVNLKEDIDEDVSVLLVSE